MNLEKQIINFQNDMFDKIIGKGNLLKKSINNLEKNKKEILLRLKDTPAESGKLLINFVDRLCLINDNLNAINSELDKLQYEVDKKLVIEPTEEINIRNKEYEYSNKILKPFLPFMLLYSLSMRDEY